jgi:hypothetical protein
VNHHIRAGNIVELGQMAQNAHGMAAPVNLDALG